jgi:hypothetical protein
MSGRDYLRALQRVVKSVIALTKEAWLLPRSIPGLIKQRRKQSALNAREEERLDRIRNPSDYHCK